LRQANQKMGCNFAELQPHSVVHVSYVPFPGLKNKQPQGVNDCLFRLPKLIPGGLG
jgi:hypothetical protein